MRQQIPFHLKLIRGAIGKRLVVRHYKNRVVVSRYPDMKDIIPSSGQQKCRNAFAAAVAFARKINNDEELKEQFRKEHKLKKGERVYQKALQWWLRSKKGKEEKEQVVVQEVPQIRIGKAARPGVCTGVVLHLYEDPFAFEAVFRDTG